MRLKGRVGRAEVPVVDGTANWMAGIRFPVLLAAMAALLLAMVLTTGCEGTERPPLVLAATRDLEGFGILEAWTGEFAKRSGRRVELVTASDLEVLDMGRHGECDLLITHLDWEEERLERNGFVDMRTEVMRDDFLLVGPPGDPAGAGQAGDVYEALKRIAAGGHVLVARSDGSGVAAALDIMRRRASLSDFPGWKTSAKGGMEGALRQASQEGGYTLCDGSTYRRLAGEVRLEVLLQGGENLVNSYRVMVVTTLAYPDTDREGAEEFVRYLLSGEARRHFGLGDWRPPE